MSSSKATFFADLPELLVQEKITNLQDLEEAFRESARTKESLLDTLIRLGKFDDKALVHLLSDRLGYTAINPAIFTIDRDLIHLLPKQVAEKYLLLPISRYEKTLTVAFANPANLKAIDELQAITGMRIKPTVAAVGVLKKLITRYYSENYSPDTENKVGVEDQMDNLVKMIEEYLDELTIKMLSTPIQHDGFRLFYRKRVFVTSLRS